METRANHILVGSFVLIILVGTAAFFLWLAKFQFDAEYTRYDIRFPGSVSGLKVGSTVELNGIPVGEVIHIGIDPEHVESVIVTIEVPAATPVRTDTVASMQIKGLTGGVSIQLAGGTQEAPPLLPKPGQKRAVIASRASSLEKLLADAPELLQNLQVLVARASAMLNEDNQAAFSQSLHNVSALTGALAARTDDIQQLMDSATQTMANLRDASNALKSTAETVDTAVAHNEPQVAQLISDLRKTANTMNRVSGEIEAMVKENRGPVRDFTSEGLYALTNFLTDARALIDGLNRVTTQVERDPARFIFGNQQQGYETAK